MWSAGPPDRSGSGWVRAGRTDAIWAVSYERLTWSLTPHSPAVRMATRYRRNRPASGREPFGTVCGTRHLISARPRQPGTPRAGLTPKPHHAQQPVVALRGSFRLRLASTCNHRPARSSRQTVYVRGLPLSLAPPRVHEVATWVSHARNTGARPGGPARVPAVSSRPAGL